MKKEDTGKSNLSDSSTDSSLSLNSSAKVPDQFEVLEILGEGGMGVVYKARDLLSKRLVAIKVLKVGASSDALRRFQREAQAASSFQHPNSAQVLQFSIFNDAPFLVLEYVEGETLSAKLLQGPLSEEMTLTIAKGVGSALAKAHRANVIHRDLKPSNIIVQSDQTAKVLDFGIAKILDQTAAVKLTQTGEVFGSPQYMSPEQLKGESVDQRSDVYSLGAVMYECLCGRPPHEADSSFGVMTRRLSERPAAFTKHGKSISAGLSRIVFKCLEMAPDLRYQNASELLKDIETFENSRGFARFLGNLKSNAQGFSRNDQTRSRFRSLAITCGGALALVVIGVLSWSPINKAMEQQRNYALFDRANESVAQGDWGQARTELDTLHSEMLKTPHSWSYQQKISVLGNLIRCLQEQNLGPSDLKHQLIYANEYINLAYENHDEQNIDDIDTSTHLTMTKQRLNIIDAMNRIAVADEKLSAHINNEVRRRELIHEASDLLAIQFSCLQAHPDDATEKKVVSMLSDLLSLLATSGDLNLRERYVNLALTLKIPLWRHIYVQLEQIALLSDKGDFVSAQNILHQVQSEFSSPEFKETQSVNLVEPQTRAAIIAAAGRLAERQRDLAQADKYYLQIFDLCKQHPDCGIEAQLGPARDFPVRATSEGIDSALLLLKENKLSEAAKEIQTVAEFASAHQQPIWNEKRMQEELTEALFLQGEIAARRGDVAGACKYFERGVSLYQEHPTRGRRAEYRDRVSQFYELYRPTQRDAVVKLFDAAN